MKKLIFRASVYGVLGGVIPPNSVKLIASEISTDIKNTGIVSLVVKKLDFGGSTLGAPRGGGGVAPSNYVEVFVCCIC